MKFGLFTSGYQFTDLEKAFADAKAFGYHYIELWGGYPHAYPEDMDEERIQQILELSSRYQIPIRVYTPEMNAYAHNISLADEKQQLRIENYLYKSIDIAKAFNAPYVLISLGKGQEGTSYQEAKLLTFLKKISAYAEKQGRILLLETLTTMESNVCCTTKELAYFLQEVSSPSLQAMCDLVAAYDSQETWQDYQRCFQEKLQHLHFIDGDGISEDHLLPGEGIYPLQEIFQSLKKSGYSQGVTIELVSKYCDRPSWSFAEAMKRIKEYEDA